MTPTAAPAPLAVEAAPAVPAPAPAPRRPESDHKSGDLTDHGHAPGEPTGKRLWILALTALGVVYGDIGTSPLYAIRECFLPPHGGVPNLTNVMGVLSLIFWSLVIVITLKYLVLVMRADNKGEGGILALMALIHTGASPTGLRNKVVVGLGLFGAALLYGDGTITPAISVLSAVEGVEVEAPGFAPYVVPTTIAILCGLFLVQKKGTKSVGVVFGPITLIWFFVLIALGIRGIASHPAVLAAVWPGYALDFFREHSWHGFLALGAVFLVVTGGEALYADMGHFGKKPIRLAWFALVLPALLINYFGQGALLLEDATAIKNPFFLLAPTWARYPLVGLSAIATVIASQAVISGAFSLTRQAVYLGYWPRTQIDHTSAEEVGQIYVPVINWALLATTIALVLGFRRSSNLAAAYGIAVTTTMVITTLLIYIVARERWGWSAPVCMLLFGSLILLDLAFFGANLTKVIEGGWFPLLVGGTMYLLMATWKRGREILWERLQSNRIPLGKFIEDLGSTVLRIPGTAVFMTSWADGTPTILPHHVRHNRVLQERVILLNIKTEEIPKVSAHDRITIERHGKGFVKVLARFGFMETPTVARIFRHARRVGLDIDPATTTFYLGRETLLATERPGMAIWREELFAFMSRNALQATAHFQIPAERVFEIGVQIEL